MGYPPCLCGTMFYGKLWVGNMASWGVFSFEEERLRYPSNLSQCCLKVAKITHDHDTPLAKGTLWLGWMKWFKIRNPNSTLRVVQGLEQCMMKGLCLENVTSLHDNLCDMYYRHNYRNTHIQGGMVVATFWPKRGYKACILSHR